MLLPVLYRDNPEQRVIKLLCPEYPILATQDPVYVREGAVHFQSLVRHSRSGKHFEVLRVLRAPMPQEKRDRKVLLLDGWMFVVVVVVVEVEVWPAVGIGGYGSKIADEVRNVEGRVQIDKGTA